MNGGGAVDDSVTIEQAMESPEQQNGKRAKNERLVFIDGNKRLTLIYLRPGIEAALWKAVLECKRDELGRLVRYQAYLGAKWYLPM